MPNSTEEREPQPYGLSPHAMAEAERAMTYQGLFVSWLDDAKEAPKTPGLWLYGLSRLNWGLIGSIVLTSVFWLAIAAFVCGVAKQ